MVIWCYDICKSININDSYFTRLFVMRKIHHRRSSYCPVQEGSGQGRRGDPAEMTRFLSQRWSLPWLIWCSTGDPDLSLVGDWCPRPRPNWCPEVVDNVWHSNEGTASQVWDRFSTLVNGERRGCNMDENGSMQILTKTVNWRWPYPTTASMCAAKNRGRRWVGSVAASCFFDSWVSAELEFN